MRGLRPEQLITFLPPPRRSWWRMVRNVGWDVLTFLSPTFPLIGAALGYVVAAALVAALSGCAAVAFYERHTKPLPCEPNLCTDAQWAEQDRLPPIPVDLGPHRFGQVTP